MSAIRNPTELSADIMRTWSSASLGSRIVVTGTEAQSLEELSNHPFTPLGALLAIETVIKVRGHISSAKCLDPNFQPFSDAKVVCLKTIQEFMDTLDHTIPLAWIHLGHGDFEYEIGGENEDGEWGADYAMLSNGEYEGDWIRTEKISEAISVSKGSDSILFCILPVCKHSVSIHIGPEGARSVFLEGPGGVAPQDAGGCAGSAAPPPHPLSPENTS